MRDILPKILKWHISAFFLILGLYFLVLVEDTGSIQPIILAVFCFGMVYWLFKARSDIKWEISAASVVTLLLAAGASAYSGVNYGLLGMGFYPAWIGWAFLIGTPVMGFAYKKYG